MRRSASALAAASSIIDADPDNYKHMDFISSPSKPHNNLFSPFLVPSTPPLPRVFSSKPSNAASNGRLTCFCTSFLLILSFSVYLFSISKGFQFSTHFQNSKKQGYMIIIDAGSSGSRLHVFHYINEGPLPLVSFSGMEDWSLKTKPGLSAFSEHPNNAGSSLLELVQFAASKIPEKERAKTRIYLMATAGLRRLHQKTQDAILKSCRVILGASGFSFRDEWASVITGIDEGVYAWVAANYALGTLGRNPHDTTGIIELGGASAQVTFIPGTDPPPEFLYTLELGGTKYTLYTHSFLHLGQEAAWDGLVQHLLSTAIQPSIPPIDRVIIDPCTPKGYVTSSIEFAKTSLALLDVERIKVPPVVSAGNFSACRNVASKLLQAGQDECVYQRCAVGSIFVPELKGKFFATENFFYTSQFFGLVPRATLSDIENAGQHFCEENWRKLVKKHSKVPVEDLLKYCFSSAYIVALLHDSLGMPMNNDRLVFTNRVGKISLDWALGALVVKTKEDVSSDTTSDFSENYRTIFSFLTISLFLGLAFLAFNWWRRPNTKTIYDLEKGRYITTIVRTSK